MMNDNMDDGDGDIIEDGDIGFNPGVARAFEGDTPTRRYRAGMTHAEARGVTASILVDNWINGNRKAVMMGLLDKRRTRAQAMHLLILVLMDPRMGSDEIDTLSRLMVLQDD